MKEINIDFLTSLVHLPIIKREVMKYGNVIIQQATFKNEEEKLVEEIIENILIEIKSNNILADNESIDLIKGSLRCLLLSQIPLSRLAKKIRDQINDRPSMFE